MAMGAAPRPRQTRQVRLAFSRPDPAHRRQVTTGGVTLTSPAALHTGHRHAWPFTHAMPVPLQYAQRTRFTNRFLRAHSLTVNRTLQFLACFTCATSLPDAAKGRKHTTPPALGHRA